MKFIKKRNLKTLYIVKFKLLTLNKIYNHNKVKYNSNKVLIYNILKLKVQLAKILVKATQRYKIEFILIYCILINNSLFHIVKI